MSDEPPPLTGIKLLEEIAAREAELDTLTEESKSLRALVSQNDKQRAKIQADIKRLEEIAAASRENVTVSDHAVIRYLERRYGFDFEDVRAEMLTPAVRSAVNAGAAAVKVDGGSFKIKDRTITTYVRGKRESEP